MRTCDKNYRPLKVGDVLKVFHFTGARRKKYFMYKQIIGVEYLGGSGGRQKVPYFAVSHLNLKPHSDSDGGYWLGLDEGILMDYEVVQSCCDDLEERAKDDV